jgi:hypothetical protein
MHQYSWIIWSLILLFIWALFYFSLRNKQSRKEMLLVSLWTSLLGLTEPIFVPEYWNPPSLFNLAQKTGFDIESLLFAFGVGGLAVVIYEWLFPVRHKHIPVSERNLPRHRFHLIALLSAPLIFLLLFFFTDLNPIYSTFIALIGGGIFTWYCRPDLKKKMITSAFIFAFLYFVYFLTLIIAYPGYVKEVWNLSALSGILILDVPLEELMFAFGLGFLWSSVYEHIMWYKIVGKGKIKR